MPAKINFFERRKPSYFEGICSIANKKYGFREIIFNRY
ncbi:hypothetical protein CFter6_0472 [Collimonas fungivorans]|uniref:Uncharacterized protein n=1 Tax=Collimonas fungivorans TaxID=158899 RepID=A0A127P614_9BURK|nr:hypothetical protein CFter6_0472 [Collimonas fungivorans]